MRGLMLCLALSQCAKQVIDNSGITTSRNAISQKQNIFLI
jgi:hypothetical protein